MASGPINIHKERAMGKTSTTGYARGGDVRGDKVTKTMSGSIKNMPGSDQGGVKGMPKLAGFSKTSVKTNRGHK